MIVLQLWASASWATNLNTDSALQLWHKYDGTTNDETSNNRDGTVSGTTTYAAGRLGEAFDFDGATRVSVSDRCGDPANLTIAYWANISSVDSATNLAEVVNLGNAAFARHGTSGTNGVSVLMRYGVGSYSFLSVGASQVGTGWHHYAIVFDDSQSDILAYRDGQLFGSNTSANAAAIDWASATASITSIGRHATETTLDLTGLVDDVRIYSRVLSATEILRLYDMRLQPVRTAQHLRNRR
jgi:hypothetical protein